LEAMSTALPLVVTETAWIPRLLGGKEGGIVVPNDDTAAFARALSDLAAHPGKRRQMGTRNRSFVEANYRWENSARLLLDVYQSLLQK